ncbi:hypothetical protein [Roseiterribacter gracilis]|uniref:Uncharacterized protein n=1 Tax=Roseiterribacter gracilis TaxID=2812848 RepID=A0A8S8X5S5_9PROT|nr:hypothetical protein TMPK1_03050 [Rhodospirillales bacterium TMPK1]
MSSDDPLKPDLDTSQLAALVFELASQLHAERSARIALQNALIRAGITTDIEIGEAAEAALTREETAAALARSMLKLMRVLRESDDPRSPTRHEAEERNA